MSNASNLSTLANVLDDASAGEFLKSTGSGGVAFDTVAAGATVYSSASDLPLTGNTVGDMAYVSSATTAKVVNQTTGSVSTEDATRLYIYSGTGWYSVAFITQNPTINTVQDAGGGSTPFTLATDGTTATVVTITANDPESVPLTYSYGITSGSLNGCTVTGADGTSARIAGTAYTDNVFTVTPHASQDATFTITFTASDGINQATSANEFSLTFITIVADSNHTTLLATATGTSDNNNITDSSSNSLSMAVAGDTYAGTFSPYRSGGYSWDFDGSTANDANGSRISVTPSSTLSLGTGDYTVEMWVKSRSSTSSGSNGNYRLFDLVNSSGSERICVRDNGYNDSKFSVMENGSQLYRTSTGTNPYTGDWEWLQIIRDNGLTKAYVNGSERGSASSTTDISGISTIYIGANEYYYGFNGGIRDFRISNVARSTTIPTEPLESDSNTLILACNKGHLIDQGPNSIPLTLSSSSNKSDPFPSISSPYDYSEYSAADNGGSIFVDNLSSSSDSVSCTLGSAIGTGDFSISGWFYPPEVHGSGNKRIWTLGGNNNANGLSLLFLTTGQIRLDFPSNGTSFGGAGNSIAGRWQHFCVRRVSGTATLHLDGVQKWTQSNNTVNLSATNLVIGRDTSGLYGSTGYISDFKISTSSLEGTTVPTTPTSSTGALVHIKGTDASIIDKSQGANLKLVGNTTGSTTTKFTGAKSMYFDGTGDGIVVPHSDNLNLNGCDWTIEYWFNLPNPGAIRNWTFIQKGDNTTTRPYALSFRIDNSNGVEPRIFPSPNNSSQGQISNNAWQTFNAWHHVAFVRVNSTGVITRYINGTANGTVTSDIATNAEDLEIGTVTSAADEAGYIQDLRISKGKAHYTANFPPPTAPLEG